MTRLAECLAEHAGASRLLWIDHLDYTARLLGGGRYPWLEVAPCVALLRQAQGLLRSDVVALPVAEIVDAWLADDPGLLQVLGEKRRRAYGPLKELLAHADLRHHVLDLTVALRAGVAKAVLALVLPSPRDWVAQVLVQAGGSAEEVDEDAVDAAAACLADFLRLFAEVGIDAVLLRESRPWAADEVDLLLELYRPVPNVAGHYGWDWGLQWPEAVALPPAQAPHFTLAPGACGAALDGLTVPDAFWQGQALPGTEAGSFDMVRIPADAHPESVLALLAALRER